MARPSPSRTATYFETLELIAVQPDRGAVAGGTVVTLSGLGFVDGMQVRLGDLGFLDVKGRHRRNDVPSA
ncbi:MAG: IPT/TIG domain-containing protein [bacterium]